METLTQTKCVACRKDTPTVTDAEKGFWSPTGGFVFILILVALLWILTTSVFLFRKAPATTVTAELPPAPSPSATTK